MGYMRDIYAAPVFSRDGPENYVFIGGWILLIVIWFLYVLGYLTFLDKYDTTTTAFSGMPKPVTIKESDGTIVRSCLTHPRTRRRTRKNVSWTSKVEYVDKHEMRERIIQNLLDDLALKRHDEYYVDEAIEQKDGFGPKTEDETDQDFERVDGFGSTLKFFSWEQPYHYRSESFKPGPHISQEKRDEVVRWVLGRCKAGKPKLKLVIPLRPQAVIEMVGPKREAPAAPAPAHEASREQLPASLREGNASLDEPLRPQQGPEPSVTDISSFKYPISRLQEWRLRRLSIAPLSPGGFPYHLFITSILAGKKPRATSAAARMRTSALENFRDMREALDAIPLPPARRDLSGATPGPTLMVPDAVLVSPNHPENAQTTPSLAAPPAEPRADKSTPIAAPAFSTVMPRTPVDFAGLQSFDFGLPPVRLGVKLPFADDTLTPGGRLRTAASAAQRRPPVASAKLLADSREMAIRAIMDVGKEASRLEM